MRKIVYSHPDGTIAIVHPVINTHPSREEITEEEAEQRAWDALPPEAIDPAFVSADDIPKDRTFRNAWICDKGKIEHDLEKCKEMHCDTMRAARAPKLAALDVAYMRALEQGDTAAQKEVVEQKDALRAVTDDPDLASAKTVEAILEVWPECLL